jgi:predicted metal-binding transcription factor (methanogenesis marker protein 9)
MQLELDLFSHGTAVKYAPLLCVGDLVTCDAITLPCLDGEEIYTYMAKCKVYYVHRDRVLAEILPHTCEGGDTSFVGFTIVGTHSDFYRGYP